MAGKGCVFLMYHEIELPGRPLCQSAPGYVRYILPLETFRSQMAWIPGTGQPPPGAVVAFARCRLESRLTGAPGVSVGAGSCIESAEPRTPWYSGRPPGLVFVPEVMLVFLVRAGLT